MNENKKITMLMQKEAKLVQSIKNDTAELKAVRSELKNARYENLCQITNCTEDNVHEVLTKEHKQIQKLKNIGLSDEEIDQLAEKIKRERGTNQ